MEFLRHCLGCGRRFRIKLVSKSMVHLDREPIPTHTVTNIMASSSMTSASPAVFVVQEGKPMVIDVEELHHMLTGGSTVGTNGPRSMLKSIENGRIFLAKNERVDSSN